MDTVVDMTGVFFSGLKKGENNNWGDFGNIRNM